MLWPAKLNALILVLCLFVMGSFSSLAPLVGSLNSWEIGMLETPVFGKQHVVKWAMPMALTLGITLKHLLSSIFLLRQGLPFGTEHAYIESGFVGEESERIWGLSRALLHAEHHPHPRLSSILKDQVKLC